jgi:small multidrug resistance pump
MNLRTFLIGAGLAALLALSHSILRHVAGRGANDSAPDMLREHWPLVLMAIGLYGLVFLLYLLALRTERMSLLYPTYTGLSVLLVAACAVLVFGESLRPAQVAGAVLVAVGLAALASP